MSNMRLRRALVSTISLLAAFCLLGAAIAVAAQDDAGAAAYKKRCAMCHGDDGKGDTKAGQMTKTPDLNTAEWKNGKTVADVEKTLREGLGKMTKYEGKMSDDELKAVAEYTIAKFAK